MGETSPKMDMGELMTYPNNLIEVFKADKDVVALKHFLRQSEALHSQSVKDSNDVQKSIEDTVKKIYECKQKTAAAVSESISDAELDSLRKELDEGQQLDRMLREELIIINGIDDLERQRVSCEEEMRALKKYEQDTLRDERLVIPCKSRCNFHFGSSGNSLSVLRQRYTMKLSMYASVTTIIPCLHDLSKISGHIVARDKKVVEKFEFDPSEVTASDTCDNIWKTIKGTLG
ncbi:hypothetical protein OROMI_011855 [Orobanche minor]